MKINKNPGISIHNGQTSRKLMSKVLIGLLIVFIGGYIGLIKAGAEGLIISYGKMLIASLTVALIMEIIFAMIINLKNKEKIMHDMAFKLKHSYFEVTVLILVLITPPLTEIIMVVYMTIFAILAKLLFGGVGKNILNPALVGRLSATFLPFIYLGGFGIEADVISGATPLLEMSNYGNILPTQYIESLGGIAGLSIGSYAGVIAEVSSIAILLALIFLVVTKVIDYKIPVTVIGTAFLISLAMGSMVEGINALEYALIHILTGSLLFGAVFMATDPVTAPNSNMGRYLYAVIIGALIMIFRFISDYPEGVMFAILIANLLTPLIEKIFYKKESYTKFKIKDYMIRVAIMLAAVILIVIPSERVNDLASQEQADIAFEKALAPYTIIEEDSNMVILQLDAYYNESITILVEFDGSTIINLEIIENNDTIGFGGDIENGHLFIESFKEIEINEIENIDGVSGATVTASSISDAVLAYFENKE